MFNRRIKNLSILEEEDFALIHETTLKILQETGVVFHSEEALEILKSHGAKISGSTAFLPPELVEKSLQTSPGKFTWEARNPEFTSVCGEPGNFLVRPNSGCMDIQIDGKTRRPGTLKDMADFQKLHQASDVLNTVGCIPIHPTDVPSHEKHLHILYETLKHTNKPITFNVYERKQVVQMFEMFEIALGHPLKESHMVCSTCTPLSPLGYGKDVIDSMIEFAQKNQPVQLADCAMAGITGPIELLGMVALQNADILAGIVLIQCINPGNPLLYGPLSGMSDMNNGNYISGSPEMMLMNLANLQLALEHYKLPTRAMCGMTDSKTVDYQAGVETTQNLMMGMLAGASMVSETMGILSDVMAISFEKFILDEEIFRRVLRITQGFDVTPETLSTEVIQAVGPAGSYLTHPDTLKKCRTLWRPSISDWKQYNKWEEAGALEATERAKIKYQKILNDAPESLIDSAVDQELKKYIDKAKAEL